MKVRDLIMIAENCGATESIPESDTFSGWCDVAFDGADGWKVVIFYDAYEFDYIDHMISPEGIMLEPMSIEWPDDKTPGWARALRAWAGPGDIVRLEQRIPDILESELVLPDR